MPYKGSKRYHGPAREKITVDPEPGATFEVHPDHEVVFCRTENNTQTIVLPDKKDLQDGKKLEIVDIDGNASNNPITITQQNDTEINGSQTDKNVNVNYSRWILIFHENRNEWIVQNTQI